MSERLRILMITHHRRYKARGRSLPMAKQLAMRGHEVSVIVIAEQRKVGIKESVWDGVRVIETPDIFNGRLRSGWDVWDTLNRIEYLHRDNHTYDLVHCFETRPATIYPALYCIKRNKIPLLTDWNDWWGHGGLIEINRPKWYRTLLGGFETYYEEAFRTSGSGITVISTALAQRAKELGVPENRICHIPGGTSPELYPTRTKEECRKRVGFSLSDPIACFSSADSHLDLEVVMSALNIVTRRHPSTTLIITGQVNKAVRELARKFGVEERIYYTGYLPLEELPWYMGCADLFVLPFPNKPYNVGRWPNKISIYMCLGRPTVSNPYGDIKTLFETHKIGVLSDWDPDDFAQKMLYLIENPEVAKQYGSEARQLAITKYDWQILVNKLEEFYWRILT